MTATEFVAPGPGAWVLDVAHTERARSEYLNAVFAPAFTQGFREGFAHYGALLDTLECQVVKGFPYVAARPVGAPPSAKGHPPKLIFKALLALHPALRKRVKRAAEVVATKPWREDVAEFFRRLPAAEQRIVDHARVDLAALDDAALLAHLEAVRAHMSERFVEHFRHSPTTIVPVGDFLAHTLAWTGATTREILAALRGHSPASTAASDALGVAASAIAADAGARDALAAATVPSADRLAALREWPAPVGPAVAALLDRYGDTLVSGHDLTELRSAEMPDLLVATLRASTVRSVDGRSAADAAAAALRARVPAAHQTTFDELLAEARLAYPLRDARATLDLWLLGVLRRALLAVGARFVAGGHLEGADDVFDLKPDEVASVHAGRGPSAATIAARAAWRRSSAVADAPATLGGTPGAPPPAEWLPAGAARVARAVGAYLRVMDGAEPVRGGTAITGTGASPGRHTGRARLVRSAADFEKLEEGDILVAQITSPAYNVILPLLGGVVTDRGGLLSHPAIVSREYGIPAVVGARDATTRIPDGALVEIDGDAGTVRICS